MREPVASREARAFSRRNRNSLFAEPFSSALARASSRLFLLRSALFIILHLPFVIYTLRYQRPTAKRRTLTIDRTNERTDKRTNRNEPRSLTSSSRRSTLEKSRSTFAHVRLTGPRRYTGLSSGHSSYLSSLIFLSLCRRLLLILANKGTKRVDRIMQFNQAREVALS